VTAATVPDGPTIIMMIDSLKFRVTDSNLKLSHDDRNRSAVMIIQIVTKLSIATIIRTSLELLQGRLSVQVSADGSNDDSMIKSCSLDTVKPASELPTPRSRVSPSSDFRISDAAPGNVHLDLCSGGSFNLNSDAPAANRGHGPGTNAGVILVKMQKSFFSKIKPLIAHAESIFMHSKDCRD
jgi:hypothetical protein